MKLKKIYVSILIILFVIVTLPFFFKKNEVIKIEQIRLEIISKAIEKYYMDMMALPEDNPLLVLIESEENDKWNGPYLPYVNKRKDSWGNDYIYKKLDNICFQLYSIGMNHINENGKSDDISLNYCIGIDDENNK